MDSKNPFNNDYQEFSTKKSVKPIPKEIITETKNEPFDREEIHQWLKTLGLSSLLYKFKEEKTCLNPIKNGLFLATLLSRLHYAKIPINKSPKNQEECRNNIDLIYNCFKKMRICLPNDFLLKFNSESAIIRDEVLYGLLNVLKKQSNKATFYMNSNSSARYSSRSLFNTNSPLQRSLSYQDSSKLLIKSKDEVFTLEEKVFQWIQEKGFLSCLNLKAPPQDFNDIFPFFVNGLLLCDIVERITGITINGINRKPLFPKAQMNNVSKALDILVEKGLITKQGSILAVEEFSKNNYLFILELANLLYRYDENENFEDKKDKKIEKIEKKQENNINTANILGICQKMKEEKKVPFSVKKISFQEDLAENSKIIKTSTLIKEINEANKEIKSISLWLLKLGFTRMIEILNPENEIWPEFKDGY